MLEKTDDQLIDEYFAGMDADMAYMEDKQEIANKHGFEYASEMMYVLFNDFESPSKIGVKLEMTGPGIRYQLKKMGCKMRQKGGYNAGLGKVEVPGVYIQKGKYISCYHKDNKKIYLGYSDTIFMAVLFRRAAEIRFGYNRKSYSQEYINKHWRNEKMREV